MTRPIPLKDLDGAVRALGQIAHVAGQSVACREAGFMPAALNYPRDELALKMLCAFNGVDPSKAPDGWRYFPNPATAKSWGRVADAARAHILGGQS